MELFLEALGLVASILLFALFLAYTCERIVEFAFKPLLERYNLAFWTPYVALLFGGLISVLFGIDLFSPIAAHLGIAVLAPWAGYLLTAILVGGGAHRIHDTWPVPIDLDLSGRLLQPVVTSEYTYEPPDQIVVRIPRDDPEAVKQLLEAVKQGLA